MTLPVLTVAVLLPVGAVVALARSTFAGSQPVAGRRGATGVASGESAG